ncbi:MAG TPA: SDR family NAD(P)-dependent oxidoreductase [Pirellulales bacterium]|nr:SDR family NAD(P)-dependent oxidoreductase [Pirellulales bacterium]
MQITDHTFLVTGGASGLGAACVRRLVAAGGRAVVADLDRAGGEAIAAEFPLAACFVETDVADEASAIAAVQAGQARFGGLSGVVHCAGIVAAGRIVGREALHDLELFSRVVRVNLIGTFNMLRLAAAAIKDGPADEEGERGVIVTTASVAAFDGQIGQVAYAASKAGVAGMTLPAARELAAFGIRVVTIAPGIFDTPMMDGMPENVRESLSRQPAFPQRFGRPDEFAALVQHAIENRMLNGTVLRLDAGLRMAAK